MTPGILLALAVQGPPDSPPADPRQPYWQQRLRYDITATLDETRGTLSGDQRIRYVNNSPDSLRTFALHLYLNAFRPGSRWADADSIEGRRRFNDLGDPDYAYNRVSNVRIMGEPVEPIYPFAPDSTIVRFPLPRAVAPGDSFTVELGWEARPSTLPRRQGRRGRHYDFAQWYPRVVAYDRYGWQEHPLYPAGEFYGDFGEFHVTLEVPEDQVVGATGVPVCGDPGWERVNQNPARPVEYGREVYGQRECSGVPAAAGRKRLFWVAKDVHHFAISMTPEYRYEGGRFGNTLIHVLYRPGDEATWGGGIAVGRTAEALRWLDELFGPFPWPQLTNLHRIEGGGTEFPMMVMDGSATMGLIIHEVGHNYLMGILANNEWKEGFLDEGFTSFQSSWFFEATAGLRPYPGLERRMLLSDLDGWSEPVVQPAEHYRDFQSYSEMVYDRGALFFHQLRAMVGDSAMRAILKEYYRRWQLKHVDEAAFREAAEAVTQRDLRPFFAQWLHGTTLYDYAVGRVRVERQPQGAPAVREFVTRVEVVRKAPGVFPVTVVARSRGDSALTRTAGFAEREWVELITRERPREVELDPEGQSHDWNRLNNRKRRGLLAFRRAPRTSVHLDRLFSEPARRDDPDARSRPPAGRSAGRWARPRSWRSASRSPPGRCARRCACSPTTAWSSRTATPCSSARRRRPRSARPPPSTCTTWGSGSTRSSRPAARWRRSSSTLPGGGESRTRRSDMLVAAWPRIARLRCGERGKPCIRATGSTIRPSPSARPCASPTGCGSSSGRSWRWRNGIWPGRWRAWSSRRRRASRCSRTCPTGAGTSTSTPRTVR